MSKNEKTQIGDAIAMTMGIVFGMILFLVFYGWYQAGFADTETVLYTAFIVILVIVVLNVLVVTFWKQHGDEYWRGIFFGIGFVIAIIMAGIILGYMDLESPINIDSGSVIGSVISLV